MEFSKSADWLIGIDFLLGGFLLVIIPGRFDERAVTIFLGCAMFVIGMKSIPINKKEEQEVK